MELSTRSKPSTKYAAMNQLKDDLKRRVTDCIWHHLNVREIVSVNDRNAFRFRCTAAQCGRALPVDSETLSPFVSCRHCKSSHFILKVGFATYSSPNAKRANERINKEPMRKRRYVTAHNCTGEGYHARQSHDQLAMFYFSTTAVQGWHVFFTGARSLLFR